MADPIAAMISVLAGAGFEKVAGGINKMAQSGQDLTQLLSLPNFPLLLAGAGLKDSANSLELVKPLLQQFMPPPQPPPTNPQHLGAALSMLSSRLGPGLSGISAPSLPGGFPGGGGMPGLP